MATTPIDQTNSAQLVAGNEDLLTEILSHLPVESLLRCKTVRKSWLNLIAGHHFSLIHCRRHPNPSCTALFFRQCLSSGRSPSFASSNAITSSFDFIRLDIGCRGRHYPPFLSQLNLFDLRILQSCNGLLLCCSDSTFNKSEAAYYVCNPATNEMSKLALPDTIESESRSVLGMNLAYDPSKPFDYKIIFVWRVEDKENLTGVDVYSSSEKQWSSPFKVGSFIAPFDVDFERAVYWNGKMFWLSHTGSSVFFDLETKRVKSLTLPVPLDGAYIERFRYFGESRGHLHLIEIRTNSVSEFDVLELDGDSMEWFVKYKVNLDSLGCEFQEMFLDCQDRFGRQFRFYAFSVLCVVRGEEEDDSTLIVSVPGKIVSYNFETKVAKHLCDVLDRSDRWLPFKVYNAYQFIESLYLV